MGDRCRVWKRQYQGDDDDDGIAIKQTKCFQMTDKEMIRQRWISKHGWQTVPYASPFAKQHQTLSRQKWSTFEEPRVTDQLLADWRFTERSSLMITFFSAAHRGGQGPVDSNDYVGVCVRVVNDAIAWAPSVDRHSLPSCCPQ